MKLWLHLDNLSLLTCFWKRWIIGQVRAVVLFPWSLSWILDWSPQRVLGILIVAVWMRMRVWWRDGSTITGSNCWRCCCITHWSLSWRLSSLLLHIVVFHLTWVSMIGMNTWIISDVYVLIFRDLLSNKVVSNRLNRCIRYLVSTCSLLIYLNTTQSYLWAILTTWVTLTEVLWSRYLIFL